MNYVQFWEDRVEIVTKTSETRPSRGWYIHHQKHSTDSTDKYVAVGILISVTNQTVVVNVFLTNTFQLS